MKITFNKCAVLSIIFLLVADLLYKSTSSVYGEYKKTIETINQQNQDFRLQIIAQIYEPITNAMQVLTAHQASNNDTSSSMSPGTIENQKEIEHMTISNYRYCLVNGVICCQIDDYTYFPGDDYQDDIIIYCRPWGFVGRKRLYYATYNNDKKSQNQKEPKNDTIRDDNRSTSSNM